MLAACSAGDVGSGVDAGDRTDGAPRPCTSTDLEPNDTEASAQRIDVEPPWGCSNETDARGNVDAEDVDVFAIPGGTTNGILCSEVRASFVGTFAGLELCLFAECALMDGPEPFEFECTRGDPATSAAGRQGCCTRDGVAALHIICSEGSGTAVTYYPRIEQPESSACYPYTVRLDYR